jgi:hypothetical protein
MTNDYWCGDLLAVDPSVRAPGAALFRGGVLVSAERVKIDASWADLPIGERCQRVASAVIRWGMAFEMEPRTFVFEWPQSYYGKGKGSQNDLFGLPGVGMAIAGQLGVALSPREIALSIHTPTPAEWIGQVPKSTTGNPWESPRGMRIKSRLSLDEVAAVVPSHDAVDAVGLGLWLLGRLERKRSRPGTVSTS